MDKKISFGFSKITKKPNLQIQNIKEDVAKIEIIECLESNSIKIKDAPEIKKIEPLVIPMNTTKASIIDKLKDITQKDSIIIEKPDSELTIDELAARELIREAKSKLSDNVNSSNTVNTLPLINDLLNPEDGKESTLDDYESIPVTDYGMAMLRGMGWKEGMIIGRNPSKNANNKIPEPRPKGLGLGANVMLSTLKTEEQNGEQLPLIKGAYGKIIAGNNMGNYCQIEGFDDESGRVIVKLANSNKIVNINECLLTIVNKNDYNIGVKVINNTKYEQYKNSNETLDDYKINNNYDKGRIKVEKNMKQENVDYNIGDNNKSHKKKKKKKRYSSDDSDYSKRKHKRNKTKYDSNDSHKDYQHHRKNKKKKHKR